MATSWFASLVTGGGESHLIALQGPFLIVNPGLINYITMCITYIRFHQACKAQGLDREHLPYRGYLQPYCAWIALVWLILVTAIYGYSCYKPWNVSNFFANYTMQIFVPPLFLIWKFLKKTHWVQPHEADLVWEKPIIDAYEQTFLDPPMGFWREMGFLVGVGLKKRKEANRRSSIGPEDVAQARSNINQDLFREK